jgi:ribosomal-protein-alanine N-acetyltransferase
MAKSSEARNGSPKLPGYNGGVEFTLRDFRREDFDTLWRIDQECFPAGIAYSQLELAAYIRRWGSFTLVAESADKNGQRMSGEGAPSTVTLGFIVAEAGRRGTGHILTIDVLPAARRFGVGSKLLSAAEDRLRAIKCRRVFLETAVDNQAALVLYKKHGYSLIKTIPRYYSNGVDAFVFQKDLLSQGEPAKLQQLR